MHPGNTKRGGVSAHRANPLPAPKKPFVCKGFAIRSACPSKIGRDVRKIIPSRHGWTDHRDRSIWHEGNLAPNRQDGPGRQKPRERRTTMQRLPSILLAGVSVLVTAVPAFAAPTQSEPTQGCIGCHVSVTPGIVADWEKSRHARVTPAEALKKSALERRVSTESIAEGLSGTVVGCAECHTRNPERHTDTFEHNGYKVHVVVTPDDCATCHSVERSQYDKNIMAHAYANLAGNPVYHNLVDMVNGVQVFSGGKTTIRPPDRETNEDSCFYCHGSKVEVKGVKTRKTVMGDMAFPVLSGWPNQGVGRVNPDGSLGSCAACHTRHQFSIEMPRKPYTRSECHKGPAVPAS